MAIFCSGCPTSSPGLLLDARVAMKKSYAAEAIEVMTLGVLVALTRIVDYATVVPGIALFVPD